MNFIPTNIFDTAMAFKVMDGTKELGQVWMRDAYWHALKAGEETIISGGRGFVAGRGYESRNAAAIALAAN